MFKKTVTYEDFNGNSVTEDFYFGLSKVEALDLIVAEGDSYLERMQKLVADGDHTKMINEFRKFILMAYGEKSEDGKHFIKNDEIRANFESSAAFDEIFFDIASRDGASEEFAMNVFPANMSELVEQAQKDGNKTVTNSIYTAPVVDVQLPKEAKDMTKEELLAAFNKKVQEAQQ